MNLCALLGLLIYCVVANGQTCDEARDAFYNTNRECLLAFEAAGNHALLGSSLGYTLNDTDIELLCANATCEDAYMQYIATCSASNRSVSNSVSATNLVTIG